MPGASFAEKDGVFINSQNRVQLLRRAIDPLGCGHDDLAILQRVLIAAGAANIKLCSAGEVFHCLSHALPALAGLTHRELGGKGKEYRVSG